MQHLMSGVGADHCRGDTRRTGTKHICRCLGRLLSEVRYGLCHVRRHDLCPFQRLFQPSLVAEQNVSMILMVYCTWFDNYRRAKLIFRHVDYVSTNARTGQYERCNYELARPPSELRNKLFLLNHFGSYIKQRLYGAQPYLREDLALTTGMVFVKRFLRMKHVLIFRLSNGVLQVSSAVSSYTC